MEEGTTAPTPAKMVCDQADWLKLEKSVARFWTLTCPRLDLARVEALRQSAVNLLSTTVGNNGVTGSATVVDRPL